MNPIAQALRRQGYKGPLSDPEAVRAFLKDNDTFGIELNGKRLTNDEIASEAQKMVIITVDPQGGEDVQINAPEQSGGEGDGGEPAQETAKSQPKRVEKIVAAPFGAPSILSASKSAYDSRRKRFGVGGGDKQVAFDDADKAEAFGAWTRLQVFGSRNYPQKAADQEIARKTQVTNVFTASGALVPNDFMPELIEIVLEYGAARQVCGVTPMSRDVLTVPRLTSDVTAYWTGEAASITASDPAFDQVSLVAQKLATLSKVSSELANDSALDISSMLARSIGRARAMKEDNAFFNGDGTSTYGGNVGVIGGLTTIGTNPEDAAGLQLAAGDIWSEITQADIDGMFAKFYSWSGVSSPAIVCHSKFFWTVLVKYLHRNEHVASGSLVGGYPYGQNPAGSPAMTFYGVPVVFSNVMPTASTGTSARDTVPMLLGDFSAGAKFGEVSGSMSIDTSEHSDFASDLIAIRSTGRVAINVHDIGDGSTPGPIVGLIMEDA